MTSLVAKEMISAQETTPGQNLSTIDFTASITSKPLKLRFGGAVFSLELPSNRIDASHPFFQVEYGVSSCHAYRRKPKANNNCKLKKGFAILL